MKKLRLNKLFHWLYAFLMLYPILCFFGTWIAISFNNSLGIEVSDVSSLASSFFSVVDESILIFDSGSVGQSIDNVYYYVFNSLFGPEVTNLSSTFSGLLTHWTIVSVLYLVFDVLIYPINLFHKWIDEGGI